MIIGTVKFFNSEKGFGFIQPDGGGKDTFVHITAAQASGMETLQVGQKISYEIVIDRRGKDVAANLRPMDGQHLFTD